MRASPKRILVTGGAGFIGSMFIKKMILDSLCQRVVNLDALTYAADLSNLQEVERDERYLFVKGDICDENLVESLCIQETIDTIVHFAAESHVDRSIQGPIAFGKTNVLGTMHLLEVVRRHPQIHFHHISTDEVYGSLGMEGSFSELSPHRPNSPYSASKAASDHFVRSYEKTYGLSVTITHCSNNYGPCQNKEKLIPHMISCMVEKKPLPIYGNGKNIRDWLYVEDHVDAIWAVLERAQKGSTYDIGGGHEAENIDIVHELIDVFCSLSLEDKASITSLITFVEDRLGHDFRYSIDASKIKRELGWSPKYSFKQGLEKTLKWYLQNTHHKNCEIAYVE